jgi:hypothetical protein
MAACLFQTLGSKVDASVLDSATALVRQMHAQKNTSVDLALCQRAASFVTRVSAVEGGSRTTANQNGAQDSADSAEKFAAFANELVLALLSDYDHATTESARKAHVALASALAQSGLLSNDSSRAQLGSILDTWLNSERSKLLRDEITHAKATLG